MAHKPILTAVLLAASLMLSPVAGLAQDETAPITAETVTDAQVEAFVTAAIALEALRFSFTEKIALADTDEDRDELKAEAEELAIGIVDKAKGITPDEYLAISTAAQESEDLAGRITAQLEVMREQKAEFEKEQAEAAKAKEAQAAAEALKAAEDTAKETTTE